MSVLKRYLLTKSRGKNKASILGMTLFEVLTSILILSGMFTVLFYFFKMGSTAWLQASRDVELENNALVALTRMETEVRKSAYNSISLDSIFSANDCISFLSMVDNSTNVGKYNGTKPEWKKYVVYFLVYDPDNSTASYDSYKLCKRDILLDDTGYSNYDTLSIDNLVYHMAFPVAGRSTGHNPAFFISLTPDGHTSETRIISRYITALTFVPNPLYGNKVLDINLRARKNSQLQKDKFVEKSFVKSIFFRN